MRRIWQAMVDEPLIPFAIIGGVLFVVYGFRKPEEQAETVEVNPATLRALGADANGSCGTAFDGQGATRCR